MPVERQSHRKVFIFTLLPIKVIIYSFHQKVWEKKVIFVFTSDFSDGGTIPKSMERNVLSVYEDYCYRLWRHVGWPPCESLQNVPCLVFKYTIWVMNECSLGQTR